MSNSLLTELYEIRKCYECFMKQHVQSVLKPLNYITNNKSVVYFTEINNGYVSIVKSKARTSQIHRNSYCKCGKSMVQWPLHTV